MATLQPHLELTDGVTSIKIMDSSANTPALIAAMPYRLSFGTWSPKIAQRNTSPFGLPYLPVMEEMTIDIKGTTAADALNKLQALNTLLDQAERWYNNELVAPVLVNYQPKGSNKVSPMRDVVIGRGAQFGDVEIIATPADFNIVGDTYFIKGIQLSFWRKNGLWLCEEETSIPAAHNNAQPGPMTITWSDLAPILSPIDVQIGAGTGAAGAGATTTTSGITAITNDDRYLGSFLGTSEQGGFAAAQNDALKFPTHSTNVARFTVNPTISGFYDIDSLALTECEYFAAYCKIRNNSTTIDAYISGGTALQLDQPEVRLAANPSAVVQVVFLGIFPTRGRTLQPVDASVPTGNFAISFRSTGASITIDLDSILIVGINRATNIISAGGFAHPLLTATDGIFILGRLLEEPQGAYVTTAPPNDVLQSYTGSVYNFTGSNASVKETAIAHYFIETTRWNIVNGAATAKITLDASATRYKAYLVPE